MAFGKFSKREPGAKATGTAKVKKPEAFIFIGDDEYRSAERSPQDWRRLFLGLAAMAEDDNGARVKQNRFGLEIVYDALTAMEAIAIEAMGAENFEAALDETWAQVVADDERRATQAAKRKAERDEAEADDLEEKLGESVEATAPATTPEPTPTPARQATARTRR